jgi:hypothetical protein
MRLVAAIRHEAFAFLPTRVRAASAFAMISVLAAFFSPSASAAPRSPGGWLSDYRLGIDSSSSRDTMTVVYRTDALLLEPPDSCAHVSSSDELHPRMDCSVDLVAGESQGYGIFFERAFRRQGFFYLNADIGFGLRALQGMLPQDQIDNELPMRRLSFFLYGGIIKPYVQFGITPAHVFPDLLFSIGPALQVLVGSVEINSDISWTAMANGGVLGVMMAELVVWRFGDGALSGFASLEQASSPWDTEFFSGSVDGMDHFRARFARSMAGFKLLLPIP